MRRCQEIFPIYIKSFGGKIWRNLHSVSPDNIFSRKIQKVPLQILPAKRKQTPLLNENLLVKANLLVFKTAFHWRRRSGKQKHKENEHTRFSYVDLNLN